MPRTEALSRATWVEASAADRQAAAAVVATTEPGRGRLVVQLPDGSALPVPGVLAKAWRAVAAELANGGTVTVLPAESLLTPTEAAELLGLSRPYVARLIDAGTIPAERLTNSRHRRIRLRDLLTYQDHRQRQRESREVAHEDRGTDA
ncbi:MAG: helix-turn-helix domain-containing protein [Acidimicrobiales bacterium]|nr:helix-turn-helix domain-containing protein [Acidimicrobiales bacterium]